MHYRVVGLKCYTCYILCFSGQRGSDLGTASYASFFTFPWSYSERGDSEFSLSQTQTDHSESNSQSFYSMDMSDPAATLKLFTTATRAFFPPVQAGSLSQEDLGVVAL